MKIKKVVLTILVVLAFGQAAYLSYAYFNQPSPDGDEIAADFLCTEPSCGNEFSVSKDVLAKAQQAGDTTVECPKCNKALTKRAVRCPSCQGMLALVGHGMIPSKCTKCGKQIALDDRGVPFCPGG